MAVVAVSSEKTTIRVTFRKSGRRLTPPRIVRRLAASTANALSWSFAIRPGDSQIHEQAVSPTPIGLLAAAHRFLTMAASGPVRRNRRDNRDNRDGTQG